MASVHPGEESESEDEPTVGARDLLDSDKGPPQGAVAAAAVSGEESESEEEGNTVAVAGEETETESDGEDGDGLTGMPALAIITCETVWPMPPLLSVAFADMGSRGSNSPACPPACLTF